MQSSAAGITEALSKITDDIDLENESAKIAVGFDAEWNVDLSQRGASQPTAIIQIAYKKWINIFQASTIIAGCANFNSYFKIDWTL